MIYSKYNVYMKDSIFMYFSRLVKHVLAAFFDLFLGRPEIQAQCARRSNYRRNESTFSVGCLLVSLRSGINVGLCRRGWARHLSLSVPWQNSTSKRKNSQTRSQTQMVVESIVSKLSGLSCDNESSASEIQLGGNSLYSKNEAACWIWKATVHWRLDLMFGKIVLSLLLFISYDMISVTTSQCRYPDEWSDLNCVLVVVQRS